MAPERERAIAAPLLGDEPEAQQGTSNSDGAFHGPASPVEVSQLDGMAYIGTPGDNTSPALLALAHSESFEHSSKRDSHAAEPDMPLAAEFAMPDESDFTVRKYWRPELKIMWQLALPCILANTSTAVMVIVSQIFVGRLGVEEFAAAALANTWFNLLWSFITGAGTAMDTLASQAYGGKDYRSLLVWTYTGLIIMGLYCIPIGVCLYVADHVGAVLFHQGYGEVSALMKEFCVALIPGMWPLVFALILMKFLQVQNAMDLPAGVVMATSVVHIGITYGFVEAFGFVGAAWATTLARGMQFVAMAWVCWYKQRQAIQTAQLTWRDWLPVSKACMRTSVHPRILWEFFKLSMAGGGMNAFEGGAFEITTAFAGALGTVVTAAHAALLSICVNSFNALPFAVSIAGTIRVGNLLGSGRPRQARLAGILCMILGTVFQAMAGVALGASQGQVARIFTNDPEVLETIKGVVYWAMAFQFTDGAFGVAQGVLRGMGKQTACLWYNIIGFWVFGVAISYALAFPAKLGLAGLWIGLTTGDGAACVLSLIALARCNWRTAAEEAYTKMQEAAAMNVGTGDARDRLQADQDEGWVEAVDLSSFDFEIQYFVVRPVDPADPAAAAPDSIAEESGDVPAAPATGASRAQSMLLLAPGFSVVGRGASISASAYATSRIHSIAASHAATADGGSTARSGGYDGRSSVNSHRSSVTSNVQSSGFSVQFWYPSAVGRSFTGESCGASAVGKGRHSAVHRGSLASVAENKPLSASLETADLTNQLRRLEDGGRDSIVSQRSSADSTRARIRARLGGRAAAAAQAGSFAAALSRGGSVTADRHSRASGVLGSGISGVFTSLASFVSQTGQRSIARSASNKSHSRQSATAHSTSDESAHTNPLWDLWERASNTVRNSVRGSTTHHNTQHLDSMGDPLGGVAYYGGYRGSSTIVPAGAPRRESASNAARLAAALSRGGSVTTLHDTHPPAGARSGSSVRMLTSLLSGGRAARPPAIATGAAELTPLPTTPAIDIPISPKSRDGTKPAPTTSLLLADMTSGLLPLPGGAAGASLGSEAARASSAQVPAAPAPAPAPATTRSKPRLVSMRRAIMQRDLRDAVTVGRTSNGGVGGGAGGSMRRMQSRRAGRASVVRFAGIAASPRTSNSNTTAPELPTNTTTNTFPVSLSPSVTTNGTDVSSAEGTVTLPSLTTLVAPQAITTPTLSISPTAPPTLDDPVDAALGPIARAARAGSQHGSISEQAMPVPVAPIALPMLGSVTQQGVVGVGGGVASMSAEALQEMMAMLQQEMQRRQQGGA